MKQPVIFPGRCRNRDVDLRARARRVLFALCSLQEEMLRKWLKMSTEKLKRVKKFIFPGELKGLCLFLVPRFKCTFLNIGQEHFVGVYKAARKTPGLGDRRRMKVKCDDRWAFAQLTSDVEDMVSPSSRGSRRSRGITRSTRQQRSALASLASPT